MPGPRSGLPKRADASATMDVMSRTALLVIDVQESFRVRPNWQAVNHPDIADRVEPPGRRRPGRRRPRRLGPAHRTRHRRRVRPGQRPRPPDRGTRADRRRAGAHQDRAQRLHHHESAAAAHPARHRARSSSAASAPSSAARPPPASRPTSGTTSCSSPRPPRPCRCRTGRCPPTRRVEEILADPRTLSAGGGHRAHGVRAGRPVRHDPDAGRAGRRTRGILTGSCAYSGRLLPGAETAPAGPRRAGAGVLDGERPRVRLRADVRRRDPTRC